MIAFTLLSICSLLLLRGPLLFFQRELKTLIEMEYDRLSDIALFEIQSAMRRGDILWEDMQEQKLYRLGGKQLFVIGKSPCKIQMGYTIEIKKEMKQDNTLYRLLKISIFLNRGPPLQGACRKYFLTACRMPAAQKI